MSEEDKMNKKITVTLVNGKQQVFVVEGGRVYPKGSSQYWTLEQFAVAKDKMIAAGAAISERDVPEEGEPLGSDELRKMYQ